MPTCSSVLVLKCTKEIPVILNQSYHAAINTFNDEQHAMTHPKPKQHVVLQPNWTLLKNFIDIIEFFSSSHRVTGSTSFSAFRFSDFFQQICIKAWPLAASSSTRPRAGHLDFELSSDIKTANVTWFAARTAWTCASCFLVSGKLGTLLRRCPWGWRAWLFFFFLHSLCKSLIVENENTKVQRHSGWKHVVTVHL